MGNMNAKIGHDCLERNSMGKLRIGLTNESGVRVVRLADESKLKM